MFLCVYKTHCFYSHALAAFIQTTAMAEPQASELFEFVNMPKHTSHCPKALHGASAQSPDCPKAPHGASAQMTALSTVRQNLLKNNSVWIHYSNEHHTTQLQVLLSIQLYTIACKVAKVPHLKTKPVLCQKITGTLQCPKQNLLNFQMQNYVNFVTVRQIIIHIYTVDT